MRPDINIFVISDNHFNHWNINHHCNRKFRSLREMNYTMAKRWNSSIRPQDLVICLGDLVFTKGKSDKIKETIKNLNGRKILVKGNHDRMCMSKETRLLTKEGYKYYWELKERELIPTVNLKTKKVVYNPIEDIYTYKKTPYLFYAKSRSGEMELTNHHTLIYQWGVNPIHIKGWRKNIAENLWNSKTVITIPKAFSSSYKYKIDSNYLKLLAWIASDGSILPSKKIIIYQSKLNYVDEIEMLLNNLNIKYTKRCRNREIKKIANKIIKSSLPQYIFSLDLYQSRNILKKLNYYSKYKLPSWLWELSDKQFEIFIDEMIKGDGHIQKSGTVILWGKKIFLEYIMGLCATHGLPTNLLKQSRRNNYYLSIRRKTKHNSSFQAKHKSIKLYNDTTWCVNVKNHTLFVELRGKTFVTGNSYHFYLNNGIDFICERFSWYYNRKKILFLHDPNKITLADTRKYNYIIHGHIHHKKNMIRKRGKCILANVSVEKLNYFPILLITLLNKIKNEQTR